MTSDGLWFFLFCALSHAKPCERLERFAEAHVVGEDATEPDLR